LALTTALAKWF